MFCNWTGWKMSIMRKECIDNIALASQETSEGSTPVSGDKAKLFLFLCMSFIHFHSLLCTFCFEILRLPTLSVHSVFLINQLSKCEFKSAHWHCAHSVQKRKNHQSEETGVSRTLNSITGAGGVHFYMFFFKLFLNQCA